MIKVGLTGGYATGKSFVAAEFERLGCHLIYADELGHAALLPGGDAYQPALDAFGPRILAADGTIDRKKLAAIVFPSAELLARLTDFVHPAVFRLEQQLLDKYALEDPFGIAMIEAAILIEADRSKMFDRLLVTVCDQETQIARGMKRDHITREDVLARIAKQMPLERKKEFADYVIDTSGTKEDTIRQVKKIYVDLDSLAKAGEHR